MNLIKTNSICRWAIFSVFIMGSCNRNTAEKTDSDTADRSKVNTATAGDEKNDAAKKAIGDKDFKDPDWLSYKYIDPNFTELEIVREQAPFPGYLYRPKGQTSHPGIVMLHGSLGGNGDFWYEPADLPVETDEQAPSPKSARALARAGYVVFALCYFDCRHHKGYTSYPPDDLVRVDIRKITQRAIEWLRESKFVRGKKVALLGGSRGAEQAMLLASLVGQHEPGCPDLVVSLSPTDTVTGQFQKKTADAIIQGFPPIWTQGPAWTYGEKIPVVDSPIKIEKYRKPLLVTYFKEDPAWGPSVNIRRSAKRFVKANIPIRATTFAKGDDDHTAFTQFANSKKQFIFIEFEDEGHVFPWPNNFPEAFYLQNKMIHWFLRENLN